MPDLVAVALVIGAASLIQGIAGFGLALFAVPLLSFAIDPKMAVVVVGTVGIVASTSLAVRELQHCDRSTAKRMIIGAVVGSPFGILLLVAAPEQALRLALAAFIVVFLVVQLRGFQLQAVGPRVDVGAGIVSGALNTSLSTNGPPLVAVLHARHLEPPVFRSTISVVFSASNVLALVLFGVAGRYDRPTLEAVAVAVPALLVGQYLGGLVRNRVPPSGFRRVVTSLLALTAVASVAAVVRG